MAWGKPLEKDFTKEEIVEAIHEHRGIVTRIAKALYSSSYAVHHYLDKHPDMRKEVDRARRYKKEDLKDASQLTLDILLQRIEDDPERAYKSATYLLNKLGKDRGYGESATGTGDETTLEECFHFLKALRDGKNQEPCDSEDDESVEEDE